MCTLLNATENTLPLKTQKEPDRYPIPNWIAESDQAEAYFGYSVASAGDVNSDSFSDIIIGDPYYSINHNRSNGGCAYVYHGPTIEVLESKSMEVYCASNLQVYPNLIM